MKQTIIAMLLLVAVGACAGAPKKSVDTKLIKELSQTRWLMLDLMKGSCDAPKPGLAPDRLLSNFPGCKTQANKANGWLLVNCLKTKLGIQLFYAKTAPACKHMYAWILKRNPRLRKKK